LWCLWRNSRKTDDGRAVHALLRRADVKASTSFRNLTVWRESMTLVEDVYFVTGKFPPEERFGLTSQLRRAAVSIPSNIAEGARRRRRNTFRYFLGVALGSQGEPDVQLEIASRLKYCSPEDYRRLADRTDAVGRMLSGLLASLHAPAENH
jgi:four helix bundle protein